MPCMLWLNTNPSQELSPSSTDLNTYHAGALVLLSKIVLFSQNSNISQVISGITKPILGMLVLIWMHFSWWFQIWSLNSTILTFVTKLFTFLTYRLHSPAAWKALSRQIWGAPCITSSLNKILPRNTDNAWCSHS